jgi:hypothetical protein
MTFIEDAVLREPESALLLVPLPLQNRGGEPQALGKTMLEKKVQLQASAMFRATFSLAVVLVLSACAASTINISGSYPSPLVRKIPITVGVYYPEELRNFSFIEIDDYTGKDQYIINSGESQIELFNTVLPALFENVVMLDDPQTASTDSRIDAVFVPAIEEFQLGLPQKTKLKVYEIWMKYNMRLSDPNGEYIADWVMTAYGKSPNENFQSVDSGVKDAAVVAMRDLAASFTLGFSGIPEVNDWLRDNNHLP